jgi:hypothetical protein
MHPVTVTATMATGEEIAERVAEFGRFLDLVLSFRRDPDVARLIWALDDPPLPPAAAGRPALAFVTTG